MASILLILLVVLPIFLLLGGLFVLRHFDRRNARRLPVDAAGLPNLPGTQIRAQLEDATDDYWGVAAMAQFAGPLIPLVLLLLATKSQAPAVIERLHDWAWFYVGLVALVVGVLLVFENGVRFTCPVAFLIWLAAETRVRVRFHMRPLGFNGQRRAAP